MRPGASSKWLMGLMFFAATAVGQTAAPPAGTPAPAPAVPPAATPTPSPAAAAAAVPAWKPFQELAFLTGAWTGGASLGARFGGRVARFGPEMGGGYFVLHGSTILAAEEGGRPEETLDEEGWFAYDREKRRYVATWFFSNGVSGLFDVELLPDGVRLLSRELVNYEAGTRARMVFQRRPEGDVAMNVDLAPPGKDFVPWLVSALKKK
jgi:hypothetical protein